jgi:TRAP-type C4-dicarboxylate transport system permease large subunit
MIVYGSFTEQSIGKLFLAGLVPGLLIALFSVRSERQFCEQLDYNLLFRWFLDMDMMAESFDATV